MSQYHVTHQPVPARSGAGRKRSANEFVDHVRDLIDATDENGEQLAGAVVFDGTADKTQNTVLRIAMRRMDEAGKQLGVTVRKTVEDTGEGTARVIFWPTEKITRTRGEKPAEPVAEPVVEAAPEPEETPELPYAEAEDAPSYEPAEPAEVEAEDAPSVSYVSADGGYDFRPNY